MAERDYASIATGYARDVVEGRIPAGRYTRLACQRHLRDLERQGTDEFPYVFDADEAHRYCAFVETMPHVSGRWARGQKLILHPSQVFIEASVHGWIHQETRLRRFRQVYEEVPRKQGKSTRMGAKTLYMLTEEGEPGAEVYCGATTELQADKVFEPAKKMARRNAAFRQYYGVKIHEDTIFVPDTGSKIAKLIGNPGDGDSPSCAIIDEYHEHRTSGQFDTMMSGMGAREQPLLWVITTAGYSIVSPCYGLRQEAIGVLEGTFVDETFFAIIYHADDEDEWDSDIAYVKANPLLGVSITHEYLRGQREKAHRSARGKTVYLTKHLNRWVHAGTPFFDLDAWAKGERGISLEDFEGMRCIIGADLASKRDLAALVLMFEVDEDEFAVFPRFYLPESRIDDEQRLPYRQWVEDGWLIATPGNITDYRIIEADILEFHKRFNVLELPIDPHDATMLISSLMEEGVRVVELQQKTALLSEPMQQLDADIRAGRITHDGNPVMAWCLGNTLAKFWGNKKVRPVREREENKIDGAVAAIMARARWMVLQEEPESRYEDEALEHQW